VDSSIKYLNLSKNNISDKGAVSLGELIYTNSSITALFFSWNEIKGEGSTHIAKGLKENSHIKVLDISFNPIGSMHFQKISCMSNLASAFQKNKSLRHLDMSYCGLNQKDLKLLNSGLKYNHTILGIHLLGNKGGLDSFGF